MSEKRNLFFVVDDGDTEYNIANNFENLFHWACNSFGILKSDTISRVRKWIEEDMPGKNPGIVKITISVEFVEEPK